MAEKAKRVKLKTPKFRVSFEHLFKPQAAEEGGKLTYSLQALFPKGTDLKAMKAEAFRVGKEAFGDKWKSKDGKWPEGFKNPFRNGSEKEDLEGYGEGVTFMTLSANVDYPPTVYDKDVSRLDPVDPSSRQVFYSGCWAVATTQAYSFAHPKGNKGIAFGLLGVQKVKDDDKFGGGGGGDASDFEAVEGEEDNPENFAAAEADEDGGFN